MSSAPVKVWLHRRFVARTGVKPVTLLRGVLGLERALRTGQDVDAVARRLTRGWGNPRYAASPELVATIIRHAAQPGSSLVECGSGVTTLVLAAASKHLGVRAVTLENDVVWAARVRRRLRAVGLPADGVIHRPLAARGGCDWYDVLPGDLPDVVDLVVCDGPPASTTGGREGVLRLVEQARPAVIVLDDVDRDAERALLARMVAAGYEAEPPVLSGTSAHAVLRSVGGSGA